MTGNSKQITRSVLIGASPASLEVLSARSPSPPHHLDRRFMAKLPLQPTPPPYFVQVPALMIGSTNDTGWGPYFTYIIISGVHGYCTARSRLIAACLHVSETQERAENVRKLIAPTVPDVSASSPSISMALCIP